MFDTIISRGAEKGEFLVQVDRQLAKIAVKHLSLYRGIQPFGSVYKLPVCANCKE
jgi:hypothetical protein